MSIWQIKPYSALKDWHTSQVRANANDRYLQIYDLLVFKKGVNCSSYVNDKEISVHT